MEASMAGERDIPRELLRHTLATVAYRGAKAVRGAPAGFALFKAGSSSRTPGQILAHVCDLFDWALHLCQGRHVWTDTEPAAWHADVARFHEAMRALDAFLASEDPLHVSPERLFQGPIADALTHVGQITLLRRMAGTPVRGENYLKAEIVAGRVGEDQHVPRLEFD
jgi:hypothetical protein